MASVRCFTDCGRRCTDNPRFTFFSCHFLRLCVLAVINYSLRLPISEYSLKQNACLSTGGTGAAPVIPKCTSEHSYCCQRVLLQVLPIKSTSQTAVIAD